MKNKIFLHIGGHKTGSTSLQKYLHISRSALLNADFVFYRGIFYPENHVELYLHCMKNRGLTFVDILLPEARNYLNNYNLKQEVSDFIHRNKNKNIIFSAEGLSYLRYADEVKALKELLQSSFHDVNVLWVNRAVKEAKASYIKQIERTKGASVSSDCDSVFYIAENSFLWEKDKLRAIYNREFNFIEFEYSKKVVGELLRFMGLPIETEVKWENVTYKSREGRFVTRIKQMLKKIIKSLQ